MIRALDIAGMVCPNNVFLAPLAGYTNYPFRKMCEELGAGLTFTEMVSAKGLHYNNAETKELLYCENSHKEGAVCPPKAAQIFGSDPEIMREACESEALAPFQLIDINMGCPMPKIVRNGEGSALLADMPLAEKVIAACAKSGKRISVKFRTGLDEAHKVTAEFARMCEGAGACMITVHGRTRDKIYAGSVDYDEIAAAKCAVRIPVIANGGVWNEKDVQKMFDRTGADGVMIARAAMYRPQTFCDILGTPEPPAKELFLGQLALTKELYGERFACVHMRKMAAFYIKGRPGANEWRRQLFAAATTDAVAALAEEIFSE